MDLTDGLTMLNPNNSSAKSAAKYSSFWTMILFIFLSYFVISYTELTANAAEISEIQQRGHIVIAVKDNLRPLGFRNAQGDLQGLEIDLANALGKDLLGKSNATKLQPVANGDRLSQVLENKADIAIARVTATESRSRLVDFSVPYYFDSTVLVTKDAFLNHLSDFAKRKIAVLNHSSTIAVIRYYVPNALLVGVDSYAEAQTLAENNTVAAFAADASVLTGWVQEYPQYRLLSTKLSTEPLCVVMPKGLQYEELRSRINQALARYLDSGWLKERATYWGLP